MTHPCPVCSSLSQVLVGSPTAFPPPLFRCQEHGCFYAGGPILRKLRVCRRCGHEECPCCEDWCDTMVGQGTRINIPADALKVGQKLSLTLTLRWYGPTLEVPEQELIEGAIEPCPCSPCEYDPTEPDESLRWPHHAGEHGYPKTGSVSLGVFQGRGLWATVLHDRVEFAAIGEHDATLRWDSTPPLSMAEEEALYNTALGEPPTPWVPDAIEECKRRWWASPWSGSAQARSAKLPPLA